MMGRNVFISFRFNDGNRYKEELVKVLKDKSESVDYSEDKDRSQMSDYTIQSYLYDKLREVSVVIILLTRGALKYKKNFYGNIDDWCYDEVRYALENRYDNKTKGLIAIYVPEIKNELMHETIHMCKICGKEKSINTIYDFNHLFRKNMMNVKTDYKRNKCDGIYDSLHDSFCSLVSFDEFCLEPDKYIENAFEKKENFYKYDLIKRL